MEIEGKTIGIRTFKENDVSQFYTAAIESVEHMHQFMPWCHPEYSIEECEAWVTSRAEAWASADEYSFIVYSIESNELLGGVAINQLNAIHKIGNIGYWIRKRALNRGVATEAVLLIAGFGFEQLNLNRLEIVMIPSNKASIKVAVKAGAKYEGIMQSRLLVHNEALDACMYSIVKNA